MQCEHCLLNNNGGKSDCRDVNGAAPAKLNIPRSPSTSAERNFPRTGPCRVYGDPMGEKSPPTGHLEFRNNIGSASNPLKNPAQHNKSTAYYNSEHTTVNIQ